MKNFKNFAKKELTTIKCYDILKLLPSGGENKIAFKAFLHREYKANQ